MNLNKILLVLLVIIGIVMIYLGVKANMMKPPILSGVGFIIIAYILNQGNK
jgi:predicted tellurium resistance membrane protein TerC